MDRVNHPSTMTEAAKGGSHPNPNPNPLNSEDSEDSGPRRSESNRTVVQIALHPHNRSRRPRPQSLGGYIPLHKTPSSLFLLFHFIFFSFFASRVLSFSLRPGGLSIVDCALPHFMHKVKVQGQSVPPRGVSVSQRLPFFLRNQSCSPSCNPSVTVVV